MDPFDSRPKNNQSIVSAKDRGRAVHNIKEMELAVGRVARCPVFDRTVRFFGDLSGQKCDAKPDN